MRRSRAAAGADAVDPGAPTPVGSAVVDPTATPVDPATGDSPATAPETTAPVLPRTIAGTFWVGVVSVSLVLIALVIFLAQNARHVTVHFLGFHGRLSLALALLIALIGGALLVAIPGSVRILQLRKTVRRTRRRL